MTGTRSKGVAIAGIVLLLLLQLVSASDQLSDQAPGQRFNLTNINATYNTTISAYQFDGLTAYLNSTANLSGAAAATVCAWATPYNDSRNKAIYGNVQTSGAPTGKYPLFLKFDTSRRESLALTTNLVNDTTVLVGSGFSTFNTGYSECAVFNGTWMGVYRDAVLMNSKALNASTLAAFTQPSSIGRWWSGDTSFFNGSIDDVKIYPGLALTQNQILGIKANLSVACSSLGAWYPFTNGSETCANSCIYSGAGNWTTYGFDTCSIATATNLLRNTITYTWNGTTSITANITNFTSVIVSGNSTVTFSGGGGLR